MNHRFLHLLQSLLIISVGIVASSGIPMAQTQPESSIAQQVLGKVLSDPLHLEIDPRQIAWDKEKQGYIPLPNERMEHPQGIFWMYSLRADINTDNPRRVFLFGESMIRVLDGQQRFFTKEECRQNSLQFLKRQFPWFYKIGPAVEVNGVDPDWILPYRKGVWSFKWRQLDEEGLPIAEAEVLTRAIDGKVVGFSVGKRFQAKHSFKLPEAKKVALEVASKDNNMSDIVVNTASVMQSHILYRISGLPKVIFRLGLSGKDKTTGTEKTAVFHVDADTGKPLWIDQRSGEPVPEKIVWRSQKKERDNSNNTPNAHLPVWTTKGMMFTALQDLAGMPSWVETPPQLFLKPETGGLAHLTSDLGMGQEPTLTSSLPGSSWISVQHTKGWTYAFDVSTGQHRVLGTPERPADTPAINSDGKWAIVSATGRTGNPDSDLFADDLQRAPELALRARLVLPGGDEHHPLFSPDDKWLYFVTSKEDKGQAVHSLRRIPAALARTKELLRLKPEQVETLVPSLPGAVGRLSIFPNGQKLLLQTDKNMAVVDIATRKATPLKFPVLKDVELSGATISNLQDGWAGPGNDEVTFSGQTTDAAKKVRRRIYSCRFNGSNLRAWTPKENTPVPAYTFPQSKKTAYELAKEMALAEIKWEDAHRER